jgi:hypothetical protein
MRMSLPLLRPLSAGETLDVSFGLYRRLFVPLLTVSVLCTAVPSLVNVYITASGGVLAHPGLYFGNLLLSIVLGSVAAAATIHLISETYLGGELAPGEALRRAMPLVPRLIVLSLLWTLLVGVGLVLLFVPGLILLSGLVLATQSMVIESLGSPTAALGRSWGLTKGHRLRMFGLLCAVGAMLVIPMVGIGMVLELALSVGPGEGGELVTQAVGAVLSLVLMPLFYCMLTVAYYDLRVRKEGFDLELLAASLHAA